MSKLSEKFAAGRKALADREADGVKENAVPVPSPVRVSGPLHGSVSTMKIDLLKHEVEKLRAASPSMKIDATKIRPSKWANRLEASFQSDEFENLKDEIKSANGNIQPIKVRPIKSNLEEFEIVFGHRRHRACLELGLPVLSVIEDLNDAELFTQMDRENRQRADLRPYEQGVMYARALDEGLFSSLRKLAESIGAEPGGVSKAITLAKLPKSILDAFVSPLDLQYRWAPKLTEALKTNPDLAFSKAEAFQKMIPRASSIHVFNAFIDAGVSRGNTSNENFVSLKGRGGQAGKIVINEKKKTIAINLTNIHPSKLSSIEKAIQGILDQ